jgi:hypothetical protein
LYRILRVYDKDFGRVNMRIIGLDSATVDAKVGLALGILLGKRNLEVQQATLCTRERAVASVMRAGSVILKTRY